LVDIGADGIELVLLVAVFVAEVKLVVSSVVSALTAWLVDNVAKIIEENNVTPK